MHHRNLGAYFPDLPSNMLGSFLMGLFAASGVLGLPNDKELAILPENSSWQVDSAPVLLLQQYLNTLASIWASLTGCYCLKSGFLCVVTLSWDSKEP